MSDRIQIALLIASVIAGLSGWAAIFAWWFRERSKTVRAIKELRRTNTRLQKTVMFTLAEWRDQVMNNQDFLIMEQEYAVQLAGERGVSVHHAKQSVRANAKSTSHEQVHESFVPRTPSENRHLLTTIEEVERYARTGEGRTTGFRIEEGLRRSA